MSKERYYYEIIGLRIKTYREFLKIPQHEFSKQFGIDRSTLSQIEAGKIKMSIYLLHLIGEMFNINISGFLPTGKEVEEYINAKTSMEKIQTINDIFN